MNLSLYKATELARLEAHIDHETGEIDFDGFDACQIALADKQRACVAYIRNAAVNLAGLKAMREELLKPLNAEIDRITKSQDWLHKYLAENMRASGTTEIVAADGTFKAKLYLDRDESVAIEDGAVFPPELCNPPPPPEPSKKLIKAAIERGEPVQGANIVRKDRLEVK